jgi:protein KRI1
VRRADDTRKTKRQAREERKAAERAAMEENTRRLKGQKRREMEAQIKALKKELGEDMDWSAVEKIMDGEWDEAEWERVIGKMLNDAADKVSWVFPRERFGADGAGGRRETDVG